MLAPDGQLVDACFVAPLPIAALASATTDDAVAYALLAKRNPGLEQREKRTKDDAKTEGKAEAVVMAPEARKIALRASARSSRNAATKPRHARRVATKGGDDGFCACATRRCHGR